MFSQASVKLRLTLKTATGSLLFQPPVTFYPGFLPNAYSDRGMRPEEAPKPSTSASVPSSADSLALTSHSRA
jgi:hypothetical protein